MHPAQTSAQKSSSAGLLVFNSSQALLSDKGIKQLAGFSRQARNTVCRDRDGFYGRRREFSQIRTVPSPSSRKCTRFCSTHRYRVRGVTPAAFAANSTGSRLTSQLQTAQRSTMGGWPVCVTVSSRLWIVISTRRRNPMLSSNLWPLLPVTSGDGKVRLFSGAGWRSSFAST